MNDALGTSGSHSNARGSRSAKGIMWLTANHPKAQKRSVDDVCSTAPETGCTFPRGMLPGLLSAQSCTSRSASKIRFHSFVRLPNNMLGNHIRLCFCHELLLSQVGSIHQLNNLAPSLHVHYRRFITTTNQSAPVPRIGTQVLVGLPLGRLPWAVRTPPSSRRQVPRLHT